MAKDIRNPDTQECINDPRTARLVKECRRQEESCLYTSTTLYIWLRQARRIHNVFVVAPVVLGAFGTWSILDQPDLTWLVLLTAICVLLAGLFPAIFEALKLDTHVDLITRQAAAFKTLQDRFRQLATVTALGPFDTFQAEFSEAMKCMDETRATSITPPECCFRAARKKIIAGDYSFGTDQADTGGL